jgi:sulfur transfer complex TusBCD TusB component (DsrH family)
MAIRAFIVLLAVLTCSFARAQSYNADIGRDEYVELTEQDFVIPDNSPYWADVKVVRNMDFKAFGQNYDLNDGVFVVLKSGYIFLTTPGHSFTLYAFKSDLDARKGTGQTSEFSFKLDNVEGEKVLKLQWKNMGLEFGNEDEFVNYQVWLYESGMIDVRFGPMNVSELSLGEGQPVIGLLHMNEDFSVILEEAYMRGTIDFPIFDYGAIGPFSSIPDSSLMFRFTPAEASVAYANASESAKTGVIVSDLLNLPDGIKSVEIYNTLGIKLYEQNVSGRSEIDLNTIPAGMHYVRYTNADGAVVTQKLLKR